ncbi:hypothetical protein KKH82_04040 [Patescibacteria group bacterium]|nr:hypothetical protein [Patescibacteria group bacterium]
MIDIQENISLKKYNTLHVDVKAKFFVKIQTTEEFMELMKTPTWDQNKFFILGGGANVLFSKNWDGIVIKNEILGKEIVGDTPLLLKV